MCEGNLSAFANKTTYIRSPTAHESRHLVHEMVDFIYLDTRHDYCEVRERGEGGLQPGLTLVLHTWCMRWSDGRLHLFGDLAQLLRG